jgi:hopene-associated glycosyltransferase HpnB
MMQEMIAAVSLLSLAAWAYLLLFRGSFWRSRPVLPEGISSPAGTASTAAKVAVVVPARDEAASIRQSLGSLLAQEYPGELAIVLVDDNSSDGTGRIAASLRGGDRVQGDRLHILAGKPLPAGWSGKMWAVHQGLSLQPVQAADYVLLTDADIVHAPGHVAALVAKAEADRLDLVSEMVHLHCATAAERALIPAFVFFFQMLYPFAWVADPRKRTAGAAGGSILVRRAVLDRIEGVQRIRNRLIDDCALAREIQSAGGRLWLGHSEQAESIRVYASWRDVWDMIARTAYEQLGYSPLFLLGCIAVMGLLYGAPPLLAVFAHGLPRFAGGAAWLAMAVALQPTLARYRRSPLWGIALPAIALFYAGATVASAMRHFAGRGGGWKKRVYAGTSLPR